MSRVVLSLTLVGVCACGEEQASAPAVQVLTTCGDGVAEGVEACDGDDLRGKDCLAGGFVGGVLACSKCALDQSECIQDCAEVGVGEPIPGCGLTAAGDLVCEACHSECSYRALQAVMMVDRCGHRTEYTRYVADDCPDLLHTPSGLFRTVEDWQYFTADDPCP